jgi:alpha-D-ribose 1-methylphosphonate 5-triphosphate diphosphatase PhnM
MEFLRRPAGTAIASFEPGVSLAPASIRRMLAALGGAPPAPDQRPSPVALIRAARAAGVIVVAGSGGGVPGISLLRELELFVQAGMTPLDALQAATSIPAQLMKMDDSGTVEAGKRADLVVLTGDPLADISNVRTARWVIANGRLYDCQKLAKAAGFTATAGSRPPDR